MLAEIRVMLKATQCNAVQHASCIEHMTEMLHILILVGFAQTMFLDALLAQDITSPSGR